MLLRSWLKSLFARSERLLDSKLQEELDRRREAAARERMQATRAEEVVEPQPLTEEADAALLVQEKEFLRTLMSDDENVEDPKKSAGRNP